MYLKFVRNIQPCGEVRRGTLYSVHFQPNEMGDYNEELTIISDAYEIPRNESFPLPLIYQAQVVRLNGYLRLTFGDSNRKSALHLIRIFHYLSSFISFREFFPKIIHFPPNCGLAQPQGLECKACLKLHSQARRTP